MRFRSLQRFSLRSLVLLVGVATLVSTYGSCSDTDFAGDSDKGNRAGETRPLQGPNTNNPQQLPPTQQPSSPQFPQPPLVQQPLLPPTGTQYNYPQPPQPGITPDGPGQIIDIAGGPGQIIDIGGGSGNAAPKPDALITDGGLIINNQVIGKIEVDVTLDHRTSLMIKQGQVYFSHYHLGFPSFALLRLYDTTGKLIDTKNYLPLFKPGQGPNCAFDVNRSVWNLDPGGECWSVPITLAKGHRLTGNLEKLEGRGYVGATTQDGGQTVVVSAYDCGSNCGSPAGGGGLGGTARYRFIIQ